MAGGLDWTSADLLAEARNRGFKASERLIVDWTQLGLLDRPTRRRGTGLGSALAVRSEQQAELFFNLLDKRRTATRVAVLCNIPVFQWFVDGERHVPIRQVRRAMRTFAKSVKNSNQTVARHTAADYVAALNITDARKRRQLRTDLTKVFTRLGARPVTELGTLRDDLAQALRDAVTPSDQRLEPYITATLNGLDVRLKTTALFRNGTDTDVFPDGMFHLARFQHRHSLPDYIAQDPRPEQLVLDEFAGKACLVLLLLLGIQLAKVDDTPT